MQHSLSAQPPDQYVTSVRVIGQESGDNRSRRLFHEGWVQTAQEVVQAGTARLFAQSSLRSWRADPCAMTLDLEDRAAAESILVGEVVSCQGRRFGVAFILR